MSLLHAGDPLTALELVAGWRLLLAAVLGGLLGIERSVSGKHAGMRTYALVSLGSCLFIVAGDLLSLLTYGNGLDPSRIAAAVIMGIGFIGSGLALLRSGEGQPGEITTATGIWVVAGIGMIVGLGFYALALLATVLATLIFTVLMRLEEGIVKRFAPKRGEGPLL